MRHLRFLFISLLLAPFLRANAPFTLVPLNTVNVAGTPYSMTGTATYALNMAISGTTSSPIDLGLYNGFAFSVTGTGSAKIDIYQSNNSTTASAGTTQTAGSLLATFQQGSKFAQECYSFTKQGGRYVWFYIEPLFPGVGAALSVTPPASSTTLWYYTPTGAISSTSVISGVVSVSPSATGLFAQESGGNLASAVTSLQLIAGAATQTAGAFTDISQLAGTNLANTTAAGLLGRMPSLAYSADTGKPITGLIDTYGNTNWAVFDKTIFGWLSSTAATSALQTTGNTALTTTSAVLQAATSTAAPFFVNAGTTAGIATYLSEVSGTIIDPPTAMSSAPATTIKGLNVKSLVMALNGSGNPALSNVDTMNGAVKSANVGLDSVSQFCIWNGTNNSPISSYPQQTFTSGVDTAMMVSPLGVTNTYEASFAGIALAATASDFFTITGSASHTVAITKIEVSGIATAIGASRIFMIKRSTADSGGTSSSTTAGALSSLNIPATATLKAYTVNPLTGTAVSQLETWTQTLSPASTTTIAAVPHYWEPGYTSQPIILSGTSEVLSLSENQGAILSGETLDISIWFQEY